MVNFENFWWFWFKYKFHLKFQGLTSLTHKIFLSFHPSHKFVSRLIHQQQQARGREYLSVPGIAGYEWEPARIGRFYKNNFFSYYQRPIKTGKSGTHSSADTSHVPCTWHLNSVFHHLSRKILFTQIVHKTLFVCNHLSVDSIGWKRFLNNFWVLRYND